MQVVLLIVTQLVGKLMLKSPMFNGQMKQELLFNIH